MNAILEFNSICKTFRQRKRNVHALKKVSFNVNEGEVFGFVGPNGAGKSTTIKIMLDVIRDYSGTVHIHGKDARLPEARIGVSYLPEAPALYEQFTPLEVLNMTLRMYGIKRKDSDKWSMHWMERFSIEKYATRRIRHLSKGNVQRTALACALAVAPKLMVLDEPLSGLDPVGRKDVIDILSEYKAQGGAIFFTSHVLHDVERVADRFGLISNGELLAIRKPSEFVIGDNSRFIVRYYSDSTSFIQGKHLRENEYEYELGQNELPEFITQLNQATGKLISIKPASSLESLFFKIIDESKNNPNTIS